MRQIPVLDEKVLSKYHWDRVKLLTQGIIPSPSNVEIDLTDEGCNQACIHCCFQSGRNKKVRKLNSSDLLTFIKEVYANGTSAFELVGGGEPTNHPEIGQIIDAIHALDVRKTRPAKIGLVTNGLLLQRIFKEASEGKITWARISLDSADPNTYHLLHGVPATNHFAQVLANITEITKLMPANDVGIGYLVVPPYNHRYEQIMAGAQLASELGVGHIGFRPAELDEQIISQDMWAEAEKGIADARLKYGSIVKATKGSWDFITSKKQRGSKSCLTRPLVMVIKANGDLASCFLFRNETRNNAKRPILGNIKQGYEAVWLGEAHRASLRAVNRDECPSPCKLDRSNYTAEQVLAGVQPFREVSQIQHTEFI